MNSSSILVKSSRFSMYNVMSFANMDSLTSFSIRIHFTSFSSLIAVARTSRTMLNKNSKNGKLCLVPDLEGMVIASHQ